MGSSALAVHKSTQYKIVNYDVKLVLLDFVSQIETRNNHEAEKQEKQEVFFKMSKLFKSVS